jgi:hypothetical protein
MGLAIPAIVKVAYMDDSHLNLVPRGLGGGSPDFKSKTIVYKIWNEGVRHGEIGDVWLELSLAGSKHRLRMYETTGNKIFIDPGKVDIVSFAILPGDIHPLKETIARNIKDQAGIYCQHNIQLYGFRGNQRKIATATIASMDCRALLESYL